MYVARRNVMTGATEWVPSEREDEGVDGDSNDGVAASMHLDMLNDTERNEAYAKGLEEVFASLPADANVSVLDIGTGSGLLAMLAARIGGAKVERVTACEVFPSVARAAERIVASNGLANTIDVIPLRSTDLVVGEHLRRRADILVTEIFDTELLGEGVLPTLRHAWQTLLQKDAIVVPASATVYAQLVESPLLAATFHLDDVVGPSNGASLMGNLPCRGPASPLAIQALALSKHIRPLSEPFSVFSFDFSCPPSDGTYAVRCRVPVTADGRVDAIVYWWTLTLAPGVELTMAPGVGAWRDHWMQSTSVLPRPLVVRCNDVVSVRGVHDDYSIWFDDAVRNVNEKDALSPETPTCTCGLHLTMMRARIASLHDPDAHWAGVIDGLSALPRDLRVLQVGDDPLAAVVATQLGFTNVVTCDDGVPIPGRVYADRVLPSCAPNVRMAGVSANDATLADIGDLPAEVLLAEPHFAAFQHDLPWRRFLRLWFLYHDLSSRGLLAPKAVCVPAGFAVTARLVRFKDLWKSHAPLIAPIRSDIDVAVFNRLAGVNVGQEWSDLCFPFDLGSYEHEWVGDSVDVWSASIAAAPPADTDCHLTLPLEGNAAPNAVVLSVHVVGGTRSFPAAPASPFGALTRHAVLFLIPTERSGAAAVRLRLRFFAASGDVDAMAKWE